MNDYVTGTGQIIGRVHEPDAQCLGGCVIHSCDGCCAGSYGRYQALKEI